MRGMWLNGFFYWSGVLLWICIVVGFVLVGYFSLRAWIDYRKEEHRPKLDVVEGQVLPHETDTTAADPGLSVVSGKKTGSRTKRNQRRRSFNYRTRR